MIHEDKLLLLTAGPEWSGCLLFIYDLSAPLLSLLAALIPDALIYSARAAVSAYVLRCATRH